MTKRVLVPALAVSSALVAAAMAQEAYEPGIDAPKDQPPDENASLLPKRVCIEHDSPYYTPCGSYIGVRFKGEDVTGRVVEYNVTMGWVRLVAPELTGKPLTRQQIKAAEQRFGEVEPYWRIQPSRQVRRQLERML